MHNVWLIARREYLERVRAKSFMIMTLLIPAIMGALVYGGAIINGRGGNSSQIAVVTQDLQFGQDLQTEFEGKKDSKVDVDVISPGSATTRATLDAQLKDRQLDGYLWVTPASSSSGRANFQWVPRSKTSSPGKSMVADAVRAVLIREGLSHSGMGASDVGSLMQSVDLNSSQAKGQRQLLLRRADRLRHVFPDVLHHPLLRDERGPFHHRREDVTHLRGPARHDQARGDDGR